MKSRKKIFMIIASAVVVLAVLLLAVRKDKDRDNTSYTVMGQIHENIIEISGNVEAAQEQVMKTKNDGTVKKVNVKVGDYVKKGDPIVELDASEQEYNLANHMYEMEQTRINGSPKKLNVMEMQKAMLVNKLEDRTITARFDGIVVDLNINEGDYLNTDLANDIGTIIDRSYLYAEVEVVETDAARLRVGQDVIFSFPAYPDMKVKGYVDSYPAIGRITSRGATVIDVEIRIDDPPEEILPGFSFTADIVVSRPENVVLVDSRAIGYEKGSAFIDVRNADGKTERRSVKVDTFTNGMVKILEGAKPGDVLLAQKENISGNARMGGAMGGMRMPGVPMPGGKR
ncbi:MAG: efflux RND transporter periplasmic adaptor subunit [Spirochaetia bacterium]|nr:efflux RND transporter periplasmic adaptor subunit [Spirochaetia bacterium]